VRHLGAGLPTKESETAMKIDMFKKVLVVMTVAGAVAVVGCSNKSETEPVKTPGMAEKAGAVMDQAAAKTMEAATNAAAKTTEAANAAAAAAKDATGKALEKTGAAVEQTGVDLQKK